MITAFVVAPPTSNMSGASEQLVLYQEALHWLEAAAEESQKTRDVDLHRLISAHECCSLSVQRLLSLEGNPIRLAGLEQLAATLSYHQRVLLAKRFQLESVCHAAAPGEPGQLRGTQGDELAQRRLKAIQAAETVPSNVKFCSVAGLDTAKQVLQEAVILPMTYPHLFTGNRRPWRRILLYGPPGTGKTRLAHAVAAESQSTFYSVSSSDLLSSWVGESEKLIRDLFHHARQNHSILFIDEVDCLCRQRSSKEEEHTRRIKTELLRQTDAVEEEHLFLLCATNCPWELDPAFLRRFQKKIFIPLPSRKARHRLLDMHLGASGAQLSSSDLELVAGHTQGYSGSDIAHLVADALLRPIRELQSATYWKPVLSGQMFSPCEPDQTGALRKTLADMLPEQVCVREVVLSDLLQALQCSSCSVSQEDMEVYHDFTAKYGQTG